MRLYPCDPNKNTKCNKYNCGYLTALGECQKTTNPKYAKTCEVCKLVGHNDPVIRYRSDKAVTRGEFNSYIAKYCPECGRKLED